MADDDFRDRSLTDGDELRAASVLPAGDALRANALVDLARRTIVRPELILVVSSASMGEPGAGAACIDELDTLRDDCVDDWSALIFDRLRLITCVGFSNQ